MPIKPETMAVLSSTITASSLIPARLVTQNHHNLQPLFCYPIWPRNASKICMVQAAKPPARVEVPKVVPKFNPSFLGFTKTAEIWNPRACMIGLVGIFIVELAHIFLVNSCRAHWSRSG
nr:light-harvesting complex-like protein OHP1, chloroplastic isoform X2 [Ziziphus jujuba var. spinosa]